MKIFALIGLTVSNVLGGTIQLPTISWNDTKLQQESQRWTQWERFYEMRNYNLQKHTVEDLARAYAQYQTQVYVNYGKVMQPWAKLQADYFNYITVDGSCNTTAAEQCVYDTYKLQPFHRYSRSNYSQMETCLNNASCQMNIQKLTPAQQEIAYRQFMNDTRYATNNTRVSIQNASEAIKEKLLDAAENHQKRQNVIKQEFLRTLKSSTINLGCNSTCYDVCSRYVNDRYSQYFTRCLQSSYCSSCFKNVITINPGNSTLDTYKIVEAEYGDVNQLSYQDYKQITHSLIQYRSNLQ